MSRTGSWTRWQDWLSLVAGAGLALSPLWLEVDTRATWAMVLIGAAIGVVALIALAFPGAFIDEGVAAVIGVFAFVAPWVFSFTNIASAAWTTWIVGVVVAATSLFALPVSRRVHRHQPTAA